MISKISQRLYLYSKYALNFLRMFPIKFLAIKIRTQDRITCIAFSFEFSFSVGASTSHPRLPFVLCCIFEPPASLQHRHPNLNPNRRRRSALTSWLPFEWCLFCLGSTWVPLPLHPTPLHSTRSPHGFPLPLWPPIAAAGWLFVKHNKSFSLPGKSIFKIDAVSAFRWKIEFSFSFSFRCGPVVCRNA